MPRLVDKYISRRKPTQHSDNLDITKTQQSTHQSTLTNNSLRHKRTHGGNGREDGEGPYNLEGEDEEEYSGEDQLGPLEEASPNSEHAYMTGSLNGMANDSPSNGMAPNQAYGNLQTLSMPMTLSQPTAINTGSMM